MKLESMKKDFVSRFWKAKADMKNTKIVIPNTVLAIQLMNVYKQLD